MLLVRFVSFSEFGAIDCMVGDDKVTIYPRLTQHVRGKSMLLLDSTWCLFVSKPEQHVLFLFFFSACDSSSHVYMLT